MESGPGAGDVWWGLGRVVCVCGGVWAGATCDSPPPPRAPSQVGAGSCGGSLGHCRSCGWAAPRPSEWAPGHRGNTRYPPLLHQHEIPPPPSQQHEMPPLLSRQPTQPPTPAPVPCCQRQLAAPTVHHTSPIAPQPGTHPPHPTRAAALLRPAPPLQLRAPTPPTHPPTPTHTHPPHTHARPPPLPPRQRRPGGGGAGLAARSPGQQHQPLGPGCLPCHLRQAQRGSPPDAALWGGARWGGVLERGGGARGWLVEF